MSDMQAQINFLDTSYQKLSGVVFKARGVITGREEAWARFIKAGFTVQDLETVILWIKRRIREGKRDIGALRFSTLISATERFEEELGLSLAEKRNAKPAATPRERVIALARPTVSEPTVTNTAKPIGEWIEQLRKAAQ
jgi:hypothetical protein